MNSLRRKPTVLRRGTPDQEREQFQRIQEVSFRKAIHEEEVPVKMKHVRNLIIGTHTDRNGSVFWGLVTLSPPIHTDVTAWKFCHTLHLILRDGHPNALRDSIKHINRITNMAEHFRHLPAGYGSLIQKYCTLLVCKLTFHQHYPRFPGAFQVTAEELESIAENDANNYFGMAVEMLEYMEKILDLYVAVFASLDHSRANSMTKMGQCRLSPLIPAIQDSSSLYDFIVRILFKLHKRPFSLDQNSQEETFVVPTDMLTGHRSRFNLQFQTLKTFYSGTRNLQYFKTLIQVPHLPEVPPNFLIEAELRSHVAPVVVLEEEASDPAESVLIDTYEPSPPPVPPHPRPDVVNSHNGSMMELMTERESLIDSLQGELRVSRNSIQTLRSENSYVQEQFRLKINGFESTIGELASELSAEKQSKESVLAQVEAAAASAEAVNLLSEEETRRRTAEDKFTKMKEVYQKLRDEHITLIRMKAEMEKTLSEERTKAREEIDLRKEREMALERNEALVRHLEQEHHALKERGTDKENLEKEFEGLTSELEEVKRSRDDLEKALAEVNGKMVKQVDELSHERECLLMEINSVECARDDKELQVVALKESLIDLKEHLEAQMHEMATENEKLTNDLQNSSLEVKETKSYSSEMEGKLNEIEQRFESKQSELIEKLSESDHRHIQLEEQNTVLKDAFKTEGEEIKIQFEKRQSEINGLNDELENLKIFKEQAEKEKEALLETVFNLEGKITVTEENNNQERVDLHKELDEERSEKEKLFDVCDTQETLISDLRRDVEVMSETLSKKETGLKEKLSESDLRKVELEEKNTALENALETQFEENKIQLEKCQNEIKCLNEELDELKLSIDMVGREKDVLIDTVFNLEGKVTAGEEKVNQERIDHEKELAEEKAENANLLDVCDTQETLITDLRKNVETMSETSAKKETESKEKLSESDLRNVDLKKQITALKDALKTRDEENKIQFDEYQSEIKDLNNELDELKICKDLVGNEKDALLETVFNLEGKITASKEKANQELFDLQNVFTEERSEKAKLVDVCDAQETLISDLKRSVVVFKETSSEKESSLTESMTNFENDSKAKDDLIQRLNQDLEHLNSVLGERKREFEINLTSVQDDLESSVDNCVSSAVDSNITSIAFSLSHFDSELHRIIKSTPDYTVLYKDPIHRSIQALTEAFNLYKADSKQAGGVVQGVDQLGTYVSAFLLYGKACSHASPHIDTAESLVTALEELSKHSTELLDGVRTKTFTEQDQQTFLTLMNRCFYLVYSCEDLSPSQEDVSSTVGREMDAMNTAILEAVQRFSRMLEESRAKDTGMQLEVNEGILGTCGELMSAVRLLVQRASDLQTEIVAAGKGGASPREFYKRNHRWTEGLISGAKTVAIACQALVSAADDVVVGKGKFEEVMVASKEIAASSMQLVMASRVKAAKDSLKMVNLNAAAKTISTLTGTVVATAESCRDKVTEATTLDFSKLSLHSAKRLEMETLVSVLETEKKLETERTKLAALRRHHYQLAGELEGWEQEDIPN